jgi:ribokinase
MLYDIITIGSTTRDVFLKTPEFKTVKSDEFKTKGPEYRTGKAGCFILGAKFGVPEVVITSGGGGTNTAITFARQGFKTACIGRIGDDSTGESIISELKKEGIEPLFKVDPDHETAYSTILVSQEGERTILEYRGANEHVGIEDADWDNLKANLPDGKAGWVYIDSLNGNEELLAKILDWAKSNGSGVTYNPGKKMVKLGKELWKHLDKVDIFSVNENEASDIVEMEYSLEKEAEVFEKLDEIVKGIVVMSKGPRGVEVSDGKTRYIAGVPESPIVDRTGAGDSFGAGFTAGYINAGKNVSQEDLSSVASAKEEEKIINAIQLGTANATSVVKYFGAKKGVLKKDDWGEYPKVEVEFFKI